MDSRIGGGSGFPHTILAEEPPRKTPQQVTKGIGVAGFFVAGDTL
jgi:hypothetical protein